MRDRQEGGVEACEEDGLEELGGEEFEGGHFWWGRGWRGGWGGVFAVGKTEARSET